MRLHLHILAATALLPLISGCNANGATNAVESAGSAVVEGAGDAVGAVASGVASVPSLVNVDLSNVLNDLSLDLNLDRANIPINAQIPITLAANICGVSINILSVSTGGQANCTAKTSSPELAQVVQQQVAAGGSVGGGAQGGSTAGTSGTTAGSGSSASGAAGTTAPSSGSTTTTTPTAGTTSSTSSGTSAVTQPPVSPTATDPQSTTAAQTQPAQAPTEPK